MKPKSSWNTAQIHMLFEQPFFKLAQQAYATHITQFDPANMEICTLSSIKTGACPEDCAYCPQSAHFKTGLKKEKLLDIDKVIAQAKQAKAAGAQRFCVGAAWRSPPSKELPAVIEMIQAIKTMGLETCATLGMLDKEQANLLKNAGLDYYNHNLDSSPDFYKTIITTRTYQDRIETLKNVASVGIKVCCGGILGMGETREDRVNLLLNLHKLSHSPDSIPINQLIAIPGTPLEKQTTIDHFEFIRTVAVTRLMFPSARIRLAAGRENMSDEMQAWCFMVGANSIFIGDKLLTAKNPSTHHDFNLLKKLNFELPNKHIDD